MTKTPNLPAAADDAANKGAALVGDQLPSFLQEAAARDAGKGVSQAAEDNIVPLIYVLQSNSPQVNRRGPDYIDGAKDGDLWLRNSGIPPVDGDKGLLFQPCHFSKEWVVWSPRKTGLGIQGRFAECPPEAVEKEVPDEEDPTKTRKKWVMPNGDECIETRYHVGFAVIEDQDGAPTGQALPFVIPFKSTGHTTSRTWMFMMNGKMIGSSAAPSWACLYRLKTKQRTNSSGTWNAITVEDAGWVQSQADYDRGAKLHAQMISGEKIVETDDTPEGAPQAGAAPASSEENAKGAM